MLTQHAKSRSFPANSRAITSNCKHQRLVKSSSSIGFINKKPVNNCKTDQMNGYKEKKSDKDMVGIVDEP